MRFSDGIAQNSLLNLPKAQKPARRRSGTCANAVPSGPICRGGGRRSRSVGDFDSGGIKDRASILLSRTEAQAGRTITRGTGILATIGATAVFVGLFGTVWGIMDSFIGISRTDTTNLAVVAPGIAEALLATAMGLVAAIPAFVMYNALPALSPLIASS
jgi:biopolymer transport protein ExbB